MQVTQFIGKQLRKEYLNNLPVKIHQNIDTICSFTGKKITEGVLKKDLIKDVFTDHEYIKYKSDYCSVETALCLQRIIPQSEKNKALKLEKKKAQGKDISNIKDEFTSLRNYHFLCTEDDLTLLKRENIKDILFNLPNKPFILAVTFGFKKHTTFKSIINYSNKDFIITTDKGKIKANIDKIKDIYQILQNWYTIIKGKEKTSQQQTYFSKDDILYGCNNYKKIEDYGEKYFIENQIISNYRNSLFLEFLAYILNKRELIND